MMEQIAAYWDRRPCNVHHSDASDPLAYSREVTARKRFVEPHLWEFADFAAWKGKRVLNLGCGIGTESLEFARHGARVTAIDISGRSLGIASKRVDAEGLQVELLQANMEEVRLGEFDLVWAWGSLHHTPDPSRALGHLEGGLLRVMVYHRFSTKGLRLWREAGFPADFDGAVALGSEAQVLCPLTRTYTRRGARRLLEGAGFRVRRLAVRHIFPWRVEDYRRGEYVRGWPWKLLPECCLERVLGWHLLIEGVR